MNYKNYLTIWAQLQRGKRCNV
uniref:Kinesin-like protein FRA1 isoform X2 n=1 Tax=Rhizophora mucronata TaxID=61149 RepID=A0A2P2M7K6_RHIMU